MINKEFCEIGPKIWAARKEKGWTQADLAAAINTDQQIVSRHECDRDGRMSLRRIAIFANALEMNPYELLGMDVPTCNVLATAMAVPQPNAIVPAPKNIQDLMQIIIEFGAKNPEKMTRLVALVTMMYDKD